MAACTAPAPEENILKTVELLLSRNADPNFACRYQKNLLSVCTAQNLKLIYRRLYRPSFVG